jgi:hypothetical protein
VFGGRADRSQAIKVYERHVADVRAAVPASRLLIFDVAQGWPPLCAFLRVPVPNEPFPHVNTTAEFRRWQAASAARLMLPSAGVAAALLTCTVLVARFVRRTRRRPR